MADEHERTLAHRLICVECSRVATHEAEGWRAYRVDLRSEMNRDEIEAPEGASLSRNPFADEVGGTGLEPVTPSLSSWCSPN
jgi:hypothetical protein